MKVAGYNNGISDEIGLHEIHQDWIEATRYLNMDFLEEHKRELLRRSAA